MILDKKLFIFFGGGGGGAGAGYTNDPSSKLFS